MVPITPNMNIAYFPKVLSQETFLMKEKLERVVVDAKNDVAIFNLPENLVLPGFPAKPISNIIWGEVFLIGNPGNFGLNIRHGRVSDLDGYNDVLDRNSVFGLDVGVFVGDSGSPIVNSSFELVELCSNGPSFEGKKHSSPLGYGVKISEFLKYS